jgi:hypothetical protein
MRQSRTYGSVRGAGSNPRPYRDHLLQGQALGREGGLRSMLLDVDAKFSERSDCTWVKRQYRVVVGVAGKCR